MPVVLKQSKDIDQVWLLYLKRHTTSLMPSTKLSATHRELLMISDSMQVPNFRPTQQVTFVGGEGVVQNFKFESGTWSYLIEMALGVEPEFGRVGAETMVVLNEGDLRAAQYIKTEGNRRLVDTH
jgi:hypothetical protein